ncbi:hypothetical protein [Roseovarius sp. Pro17]|uniref:hypothetical protein n=1 Tax=Roseovarius sp. Pro17 TaxID=3108175 RepID=UPI002D7748BF|nr:hypothetical protein [Roseovarius sp. Pro17]
MTEESNTFDPGKPVVSFDYIKASGFQSLRADGVIGGLTPNGRIHMAIYSERPAIPRRLTYSLNDAGHLGDLVEVETRDSVVREMSADIFLDLKSAEAIQEWLKEQIKELKIRAEQNDS